jgi:hypothetical protein
MLPEPAKLASASIAGIPCKRMLPEPESLAFTSSACDFYLIRVKRKKKLHFCSKKSFGITLDFIKG